MNLGNREQSQQWNQPSSNDGASRNNWQGSQNCKTREEIEFDLAFRNWEESFSTWRREYAAYKGTADYDQYEQKFLNIREKFILQKAQLFGSTQQRLQDEFEGRFLAASQMADDILQRFSAPDVPEYGRTGQYHGKQYDSGNNPFRDGPQGYQGNSNMSYNVMNRGNAIKGNQTNQNQNSNAMNRGNASEG